MLLDSQIIIDAAGFKMQLGKMLQDTLSGEIKPMITQCSIRHLYNLPATTEAEKKSKDSYIEVAKAAERRRCGHHELEEPLSTLDCLQSVVDPKNSGTNKHRYVVASQELEVRAKMREIAGVPLIYVKRSVMNLEPMAGKTAEVIQREEKGKIRAGLRTMRGAGVGEKRKRDEEDETAAQDTDQLQDGTAEEPGTKKKKVKGPKGPNPLSVKKSKKDKQAAVRHPQAAETSPGEHFRGRTPASSPSCSASPETVPKMP